MARIAVGGFQHETNSFAPSPTRLADFIAADGWPGLSRGEILFDAVAGINLPAAGFIAAARDANHSLVPLLWCAAPPLGLVEADAYERIAEMLLADLAAAGPLDALYLDLHGAMIADHVEDGEGELLRRIRALVGPDLPIVASLDLHANVTASMVELATLLVAYRTYPHVDMADTGARVAGLLDRLLARGRPWSKAFRKLDFLVPLPWQCTMVEPAAGLYRRLAELEATAASQLASLSFATGFPPADIAETGPAVLAYGVSQAAADAAAATLAATALAAEADFAGKVWSPDAAVAEAMRLAATASRSVILADTQDNPGAGTNSDTIWLTEALLRQGASAAVGLICDPANRGPGPSGRRRRDDRSGARRQVAAARRSGRYPVTSESSGSATAPSPRPGRSIAARACSSGRWPCSKSARSASWCRAASSRPPTRRCSAISASSRPSRRSSR